MQEVAVIGFGILLILHGLIHLMGTTVYMKLGRIEGLPYKTNLLGGRWELGEAGMRLFGALWVVPAVGFVLGGAAVMTGVGLSVPLVLGSAAMSLVLTVLDAKVAYAGVVINGLILAGVWLGAGVWARLNG